MDSTDRMQVRDLIEKLKEFDPKARVAIMSARKPGFTDGDTLEVHELFKGDSGVVYLGTEKTEELFELEKKCNKLEEANEDLEKDNQQLTKRLKRVKDFVTSL